MHSQMHCAVILLRDWNYDANTSLDVKLVMSDNKAAKKLHKMINLAIDDHDIDGYDLILSINGNEIMLIIDCDEI